MNGALEKQKLAALLTNVSIPDLAIPSRLVSEPLGSRDPSPRTAHVANASSASLGDSDGSSPSRQYNNLPLQSRASVIAAPAGSLSARHASSQPSGAMTARSRGIGTDGSWGSHSGGLLLRPEESRSGHSALGTSSGGFSGNAEGVAKAKALGAIAGTLRAEAHGDVVLRLINAEAGAAADHLLVAAESGDCPGALAALQAGVDPNRVAGLSGFTPLHHAAARGHEDLVRLLLTQGRASSSATSDELETPLHVAAYHGHASVCALLLDLGRADPNAPATDGDTPLFLASRRGRASAVSVLLSKGADPNQTNRYGDKAVDDATDDDTLHAFVLHSQQAAASKAAVPASASTGSAVAATTTNSTPKTNHGAVVPARNSAAAAADAAAAPTVPASISLPGSPCMRLLRSSDLKRCLRFVASEVNLWAAARVCKAWRKAASDPRLWRMTGRPEAPPSLRSKAKSKA